jgi:hypothetical protein
MGVHTDTRITVTAAPAFINPNPNTTRTFPTTRSPL